MSPTRSFTLPSHGRRALSWPQACFADRFWGLLLRVLVGCVVCMATLHFFHDYSGAAQAQGTVPGAHIVKHEPACEWTAIEKIAEISDAVAYPGGHLSGDESDKSERDVLPSFQSRSSIQATRQHCARLLGVPDRSHRPPLRPPRATA